MPGRATRRRRSGAGPIRPEPPGALPDAVEGSTVVLHLEDGSTESDLAVDEVDAPADPVEDLNLERIRFRGVDLSGLRLEHGQLRDVVFEACDLSNLVLIEPTLVRIALHDCRLTGLDVEGGRLEDVHFERCRGERISFLDTVGLRLHIEDCQWPEADFRAVRFEHLTVDRSALGISQWGRARLESARFTATDLASVHGATGLAGASIDRVTLQSAAEALAAALGVTVADDDGDGADRASTA